MLLKQCQLIQERSINNTSIGALELNNLIINNNSNIEINSFKVEDLTPNSKEEVIQIEKDVRRTFGYKKYFKETNKG